MAVYTHIDSDDMTMLVHRFNAGELISAKGIAEGVENSNYLVETDKGRFIFTVYEKRVDLMICPSSLR
jgi:homoserine kinase type II